MARKYGAAGLRANADVLASIGASAQDATLLRQYLHVVRGADREHGSQIAAMQVAYIERAKKDTGWTFAGLVCRLIEVYAQEHCPMTSTPTPPPPGEAEGC